jgi:hypothetical protein
VCKRPSLPDALTLAKRMRDLGSQAASQNRRIPQSAVAQRIGLVAVTGTSGDAGFRLAKGEGLIVVPETDVFAPVTAGRATLLGPRRGRTTLAHEAAHAIFEYHQVAGDADRSKRVPDALALQIADLYVQLGKTTPVEGPSKKFDPSKPPSTRRVSGGQPSGYMMVDDTLWAGSGGHPQSDVSEFFASAYGAFVTSRALLEKLIAHYASADPKIAPLGKRLLSLLRVAASQKAVASIKAPRDTTSATAALAPSGAPPDFSAKGGEIGYLIDPSTLPSPSTIACQP